MLQYKRHDKVNNNRAAKGEKGEVDKIHAHRGGSYAQLAAKPLAYPKCFLFKPMNNAAYHSTKINYLQVF